MIPFPAATFAEPNVALLNLLTYAILAGVAAGCVAAAYRWYVNDELPEGIAIIFGVSVIALYLNTASLGSYVAGEQVGLFDPATAFFNLVALGVATAVSPVGLRVGDRLGRNAAAMAGGRRLQGEVSEVVRSAGRVTTVTLPSADDINDIDAYDPVAPGTKERMSGETLLFPRRITVEELRERLAVRIKEDFGVGHVDLDISADGIVEYLGVGSHAAGVGPTLAPGTVAVAVRGDPPYAATPGDIVQLWTDEEGPKRVASAELRATAGDVATVTVDESDAEKIDQSRRYRLVTLPAEPQADREFASLLRNADETMTVATVSADSELVGAPIGDLGPTVAAVRPRDGPIEAIPPRSYALAAGDELYLVGRPDSLRRAERRARGEGEPEQPGAQSS
ncbi:TrkA C-terminal domain-containing protein [Halalkaliarchaeum sp. AArc-GB]|uniref:TrkA C-terminal domain-containing protein n=1 Tax=Halalkaliarchaeum sp. AArc-GB TaxID=3074078 RepID=UPI00285BD4B5|nr:TrkA C-terminal domain-containing protein [Halalkaliarchaeum sp. AArc-GB]MDR5674735.1 TrkA C-terminal domain-containing protein [Halalkaliarchaeum sp. AArc-GB]